MSRRLRSLLFLSLVVAVPATAHTFGFSVRPDSQVCLAAGATRYRLADPGERADVTVRVNGDAAAPDLRVALAENADEADFVIVDDGDATPHCAPSRAALRSVALDNTAGMPDIVVAFAGPQTPADFRIFVRSRFVSADAAAALLAAGKFGRRTVASRHTIDPN